MINLPSAQSMDIPSPANEGAGRQACQDTSVLSSANSQILPSDVSGDEDTES